MWLAEAEEPNATDALKTTYVKGTEGLNEHTVDGLNMTHLSAYAVQVRAIDWAGNRAARVRRSDDDSNQRRVVIDTIPPAMSGKPRDVHPGAGRYSVYSYDTAEEDLPAWPARQLACESLTTPRVANSRSHNIQIHQPRITSYAARRPVALRAASWLHAQPQPPRVPFWPQASGPARVPRMSTQASWATR